MPSRRAPMTRRAHTCLLHPNTSSSTSQKPFVRRRSSQANSALRPRSPGGDTGDALPGLRDDFACRGEQFGEVIDGADQPARGRPAAVSPPSRRRIVSATLSQSLGLCPSPVQRPFRVDQQPFGCVSCDCRCTAPPRRSRSTGSRSRSSAGWLGDRLVTATPEFADVARAAAALGCSERAVLTAANHNFSLIRSDYQLASHSRQSDRSTPAGRSHRERRV
jgi:hypothetical protein